MPSPLGHGLAALLLANSTGRLRRDPGAALAGCSSAGVRWFGDRGLLVLALVTAANVPDLDFVPGLLMGTPDLFHRGVSHTLAAAATFGVLAALVSALAGIRPATRIAVVLAAAYATHLLLDMASADPAVNNGIMLFWPIWDERLVLPLRMFLDIDRDASTAGFLPSLLSPHNGFALLIELAVMLPVVAVSRTWKRFTSPAGVQVRDRGARLRTPAPRHDPVSEA